MRRTEFQQEITEDDDGDVQQGAAVTIVRAGGDAAVVLKPADMLGERRHVSIHRVTAIKMPAGTALISGGEEVRERFRTNAGSIASFIWLGDAFGWARYA